MKELRCSNCKYWQSNGNCEELKDELEFEIDDPYCGVVKVIVSEDFYCNLYTEKEITLQEILEPQEKD